MPAHTHCLRAVAASICAIAWLAASLAPAPADAQVAEEATIHWAMAAYFGTGRYRAAGTEEIYALSVKPGRLLRRASVDADGRRRPGLRLRVPLSVSVHEVDGEDVLANVDLDNVSTLSAVPGLELDLRMSDRWRVKPLVYAGWGSALDGDDSAWIYWAGFVSELTFELGKMEWQLINGLTGVGYTPRGGSSQRVFPLLTGFEFRQPLERRRIGGETVNLNWHLAHTHYLDDLHFGTDVPGNGALEIAREWEIGLAFSKGDQELRIWRLSFDRVGLSYRVDASGDFDGVSLVVKSLFER